MSQENVEFVTVFFSGPGEMNKEDLLAALPGLIRQTCDPQIEWIEDPQRADGRTYHGHEGVIDSFTRWLEDFEEYGTKLEQVRDCGDSVFVSFREEGRGRASGATVSALLYAVMTFREGKVLRYQEFYDETAALEAVGLSE